ncbi:MAG: ornithine carbamoyltransferase [Candidatus Caldatribacterium sp.]|uniref:ornithine carbamoyltransferase n=1 Tax=Candidatus Caldatribacterium sp. TaxID=2282143 RepID=UPI002990CC29|nr:ornithine carbamoyltransferase [Candidatus Caldatribacterium sp.]MCX7731385.1 ornithine carbamoyltransferase [Candidatus Caldatribacterium sp.]MDW8080905.1 ornithine carbamoyltransferase [Candidatus Calescibacterium sp.]
MTRAFRGRHFLDLADFSKEELLFFLDVALDLKKRWLLGERPRVLEGKVVALLFEKPSLRTRVSFEVAIRQLGGESFYLGPQEVGLGKREAVKDVALVLGRMVDAIVLRTFAHETVLEVARYSGIPVINGLSDLHHPCQILGDLLTILEKKGTFGVKIVFVGDGNNVCHSWIVAAARLGLSLTVSTPERYKPLSSIWEWAQEEAKRSGARILYESDPRKAVQGADVVYTDVWASMGREGELDERIPFFLPYQVNENLLALASPDAIVMHCMPAHRGQEITDTVMDGPRAVIVDEAENRLHAQKALLSLLL